MNIIKLPSLESQHAFPIEDVWEHNVTGLAVAVSSPELVEATNWSAEQIRWLFRVGHPTFARLAKRVYDGDMAMVSPLSHGISLHETMSTILAAEGREDHGQVSMRGGILLALEPHEIRRYFDEAFERYRTQMPHATEIVGEAAGRLFGSIAERAMLGAALAWRFDYDLNSRHIEHEK